MKHLCVILCVALAAPLGAQTITPGVSYLPCVTAPARVDSVKSTTNRVYFRALHDGKTGVCQMTPAQFRLYFGAELVVGPPPATVSSVVLSPSAVSLLAGGTQQFAATITMSDGSAPTVQPSWTATGGSITTAGLYTAGGAAGAFRAVASAGGRADTSAITVTLPPDTVTLPPPDTTPHPAGAVWFSDWSTATGNSDRAVTDGGVLSGGRWVGGKYDYITCWPPDISRVVPGAPLGWTLTPNVLEMTDRGENACDLFEVDNAIPSGRSFYIRAYLRVEPGVSINNHPFKLNAGGGAGPVQAVLWANGSNASTAYQPKMQFPGGGTPPNYNTWMAVPGVPTATWHRHEWFVELLNASTRTYRVHPRIYDMAGNLIRDANHFLIGDPSQDRTTMAQWYAAGGSDRFTDLNLARRFTLGMEGPGGNPGTGRLWYYAAVAACLTTWCGPR
ncbi:MAG: hypothetical protein ACRENP_21050 [Longimicrobiales bacterium]